MPSFPHGVGAGRAERPTDRGARATAAAFSVYLLALPFTATAVINPGGFGVPLSYTTFGVFVALWAWQRPIRSWRPTTPVIALCLFIAGLIGSSILAINSAGVGAAIQGAAYGKLATQSAYWMYSLAEFWLVLAYFRSLPDSEAARLMRLAAIGGAVVAVYAIYQFVGFSLGLPFTDFLRNSASFSIARGPDLSGWAGLPRARGFAPEPAFWSSYVVVALGWAVAALRHRVRTWAVVVLLAGLFLSFARTGWFALFALSLVFAVWLGGRQGRRVFAAMGVGLAAAIGALQLLGLRAAESAVTFQDLSAIERVTTQVSAFERALEQPWFGLGWGFYDVFYGGAAESAVTFNLYVSIFVGAGVFGVVLFALFLLTLARSAARFQVAGLWAPGVWFSVGAVLISWVAIPGFNFSYMWVALALAAAAPRAPRLLHAVRPTHNVTVPLS